MEGLLEFLRPYAIVFGVAGLLFVAWLAVRMILVRTGRWGAGQVTRAVRAHRPVATVAPGANAWSCARCRSVNRPDAVVCYSCRGVRAEVEHLQGRI
jgi:hypothetical protein